MARDSAAKAANDTYGTESKTAYGQEQGDVAQYNANIGKLDSGQDVGADPYKSTAYLSNQNKLQSEALNTNANSGKAEMARWSKATGGLNSSQVPLAQRDVTLQTGREADTLSAQRAAQDYSKNLQYQQYLAGLPLGAAQAEQGMYGTATGGQGTALNNLSNLSGQQYGFWNNVIGSAKQAAAGAAGGGA